MHKTIKMEERRILKTMALAPYQLSIYQVLRERAIASSPDYAELHLKDAMMFNDAQLLWNYAA